MKKSATYRSFFSHLIQGGSQTNGACKDTYRSFTTFVFFNTANRHFLLSILLCTIIEFWLFKICYPYPDFFSDSYSYIFAAYANMDINIWPIGYSRFLRIFHMVTSSATALVWFQFLFFACCCLLFYFTIIYFYALRTGFRQMLYLFLFFNPLFLYLANYISSDTLFVSISILWIIQLIFILNRPLWYHIPLQAILLFIAFSVRFNAMVYPLIAMSVFALARYKMLWKVVGMLAGPALIVPFIIHSRSVARQLTGAPQFPMLSGWQWANNALYMRGYVSVPPGTWSTPALRELDDISINFFKTTPPEKRNLSAYVANYFIRKPTAPLKIYMDRHVKTTNFYQYLLGWGVVSPLYGDYGLTLIKQYPIQYIRYFIIMNSKNYFYPPLEVLSLYNLGKNQIYPFAVDWFELKNDQATSVSKYLQGVILLPFPLLFLALNIWYMTTLVILKIKGVLGSMTKSSNIVTLLLLLNFVFSISANIIVIRYQVFPMLLMLCFGLVNTELLIKKISQVKSSIPDRLNTTLPQHLITQ
ncbi:hypothetical protein C7475_109170 [Chitinophaga sp. S165]|nr:hypothetical protein C7475_109170 [Chitinophaga sp. S165]